MDINGAKALKDRLAQHGAAKPRPAAEPLDVPADAPPVYHWTGVSKAPPQSSPAGTAETIPLRRASLFSRLGLSFR